MSELPPKNLEQTTSIITNSSVLHQKSKPVEWFFLGGNHSIPTISSETEENIDQLLEACPGDELGLAAPQIGISERFFVASLLTGRFIFINPVLHLKDKNPSKVRFEKSPSIESCLSLPGITRCVERFHDITINADLVFEVKEDNSLNMLDNVQMRLRQRDAFVVQHEVDHLDGILITDLPTTKTPEERMAEKRDRRVQKKQQKKQIKDALKSTEKSTPKIRDKRRRELLRNFKLVDKKCKRRVEVEERRKFEQGQKIKEERRSQSALDSPENVS